MGTKPSFSPMFMTCFFILLVILFTNSPDCFSARKLESIPPSPYEGNVQLAKNQSKGEVHPSCSQHDGSAAGNNTPIGVVQLSPPTTVTKVSYGSNTVYSPPDYPYSPPEYSYSPPDYSYSPPDYPYSPPEYYYSPSDYPDYP